MAVQSASKTEGSPASILLRVQQVSAAGRESASCAESVEVQPLSGPPLGTGEGTDIRPRDRRGLGRQMMLQLAAFRHDVTSWMTPRRMVGAAAISLLIVAVGMFGVGIKHQLGERTSADANDAEAEGFSETVIPGANYSRPPVRGIPAPSAEITNLSIANDLPGTGVIQSAVYQATSPAGPRGAWLEGVIEDDADEIESVSHDVAGPRLR
ncbi:MAG: hypothetical protein HZA46_17905 [Planctomycetales bacterium]|nr:hypothetical protein [Planctomycetales bacterium]